MQHLNFTSIHFIYSLYDRCLIFAENLKLSCAQTLVELNHFCWLSLMLEYHDLMLLFFDIQLIIESFQIITISAKIVWHYLWTACVIKWCEFDTMLTVCVSGCGVDSWLVDFVTSQHTLTHCGSSTHQLCGLYLVLYQTASFSATDTINTHPLSLHYLVNCVVPLWIPKYSLNLNILFWLWSDQILQPPFYHHHQTFP